MINRYELFDLLGKAMDRNPDLSLPELLHYVCERKYPTRTYDRYVLLEDIPKTEHWKLTNENILTALKYYREKVQ